MLSNRHLRLLLIVLFAFPALAQSPAGADKNAALRYWNAFTLMDRNKVTDVESSLVEAVANGKSPWDEAALAKIIDANKEAVDMMVRGTSLPYCEWGVDLENGWSAAVPKVTDARSLARLNALTAHRLAARGDSKGASLHLLAGLRFARDLTQDAPLSTL